MSTTGAIGVAALLFHEAFLVHLFGIVGISGNTYITAGTILASLLAIAASATFKKQRFTITDYAFIGLILSVIMSLDRSLHQADVREMVLMMFSFIAYLAARLVPISSISQIHQFCRTTSIIVVSVGVVLTAYSLLQQWDDPHGKPIVFGFDHVVIIYATSLSILVLSCGCLEPEGWRKPALYSLIALSAIVLGMSLVRGVFIAAAVGLFAVSVANQSKTQRHRLYILNVIFCALVLAGFYSRGTQAVQLTNYLFEKNVVADHLEPQPPTSMPPKTSSQPVVESGVTPDILATETPTPLKAAPARPPSCYTVVDKNNSIAIRRALLDDAAYFVPKAGLFGIGLNGFSEQSCIKDFQVHNVILQSIIEFGWVGGAFLVMLLLAAATSLIPRSTRSHDIRFILGTLLFLVLINSMYGRISRATILFAFVGLAVAAHRSQVAATVSAGQRPAEADPTLTANQPT